MGELSHIMHAIARGDLGASHDQLALDEALARTATHDPQAVEALGIAPCTAGVPWPHARAWLLATLQGRGSRSDPAPPLRLREKNPCFRCAGPARTAY
jgi:hypothetical protein